MKPTLVYSRPPEVPEPEFKQPKTQLGKLVHHLLKENKWEGGPNLLVSKERFSVSEIEEIKTAFNDAGISPMQLPMIPGKIDEKSERSLTFSVRNLREICAKCDVDPALLDYVTKPTQTERTR